VKIAEGVPVTTVAARLGHSRDSLTLDTYAHVLLESEA
jgi:integrase